MPGDEINWADYSADPPPPNALELTEDFCDALVNAAYFEPVYGLAQLSDRAGIIDDSDWFKPEESNDIPEWDSLSWHAQTTGSALGTLVPFLLVQRGLRVGGLNSPGSNFLTRRAAIGLNIREAATTGFVTDYLTRPASSADSEFFWSERAIAGGTGAANLASLTVASIGLGAAAESNLAKRFALGPVLKDPIVNGLLSSAPTGLLTAEIDAVRNHGTLASPEELALGLYTAAYTGIVLGAQHKLTYRPKAEATASAEIMETDPAIKTAATDVLPSITVETDVTPAFEPKAALKPIAPVPEGPIQLSEINALMKSDFDLLAPEFEGIQSRSDLAEGIVQLAFNTPCKQLTEAQFAELSALAQKKLDARDLVLDLKSNGDHPYDPSQPVSPQEVAAMYWLTVKFGKGKPEVTTQPLKPEAQLRSDLKKIVTARGPEAAWLLDKIDYRQPLESQQTALATRLQQYKQAIEYFQDQQKVDQSTQPDTLTAKEIEAVRTLHSINASDSYALASTLSKRGPAATYLAERAELTNLPRHYETAQRVVEAVSQLESTQKPFDKIGMEGRPESPISAEDVAAIRLLTENRLHHHAWQFIHGRGPQARWMVQALLDSSEAIYREPITEQNITALSYAYHMERVRRDNGEPGWMNSEKSGVAAYKLARDYCFRAKEEIPNCLRLIARYQHENPFNLPEAAFDPKVFNRLAQFPEAHAATNSELRLMHDHLKALGENVEGNPFAGANISECANLWELEPSMPSILAQEAASMTPLKQLAAAAAWVKTQQATNSDQALREQHYRNNLEELSQASRTTAIALLQHGGALPRAIEALHGGMEAEAKVALIEAIKLSDDRFRILVGMKGTHFQEAYKLLLEGVNKQTATWAAPAAVGLATTFKGGYADWIQLQKKLGRNAHDASFWLPLQPKDDLNGLSKVLQDNAGKQVNELEMVAYRWRSIPEEVRTQSFDHIREWLRANKYSGHKDSSFAAEAGQWGVEPRAYEAYEKRYLASKNTPVPFPTEKTFHAGTLTGKFLRRDDPRGLFLGQHTNCCQHPDGVGRTCAWYGQENAKSGFFAVENAQGEIVAQSWVWISDCNAVVFDNCEAKGLGSRAEAVQQIYEQAATELATKHRLVTLGHSMGGLSVAPWSGAGPETVPLPDAYSGHTDAATQVILARGTAPVDTKSQSGAGSFKIRGALQADLQNLKEIAKLRYPQGWQFIPFDYESQGLVIENANKEIVGYTIYEAQNKYISDIAVKEGISTEQSFALMRQLADVIHKHGGEWSADCRDSTSYRLLKLYERRGYIEIMSDQLSEQKMGDEAMHHVVFNLTDKAPKSAP